MMKLTVFLIFYFCGVICSDSSDTWNFDFIPFEKEKNLLVKIDSMLKSFKNQLENVNKKQNESEKKFEKLIIKQNELELKIKNTEVKLNQAKLSKLELPIGFIYIQLPNQQKPQLLWSSYKWKDISSEYSGLFFRVEGYNSSMFGYIQEENAPRLDMMKRTSWGDRDRTYKDIDYEDIRYLNPGDKVAFYTGDKATQREFNIAAHFRISSGEVRPRNTAIKVWKRID